MNQIDKNLKDATCFLKNIFVLLKKEHDFFLILKAKELNPDS
jgi:hypothetical protein